MSRLLGLGTGIGVILAAAGVWSSTVTGRVYLDMNRDGKAQPDEPGVAQVAVSDGLRVVVSDAAGRYRLDRRDDVLPVWICVPRDHAPSGRFWQPATAASPVDFGLVPYPQKDVVTFVQITDTHIGRADQLKAFADHLARLPLTVDFVINTGDLVADASTILPDTARAQYDRYLAAAVFKEPLFVLPGNHEHVAFQAKTADPKHPFYGKGLYRLLLGPMHYSWDWAGLHCVALDGTSLPYQERLGEDQLAWLAADLKLQPSDRPILLFCHQSIPALRDAKKLAETLKGRQVLAAFCGHLHATFTTSFAGFPVYHSGAFCGSWWSGPNIDGTPQGFRLVHVRTNTLETVYLNREGDCPVSIVSPLATTLRAGVFEATASVLDFGRPAQVTADFCGHAVSFDQTERNALWSIWKGRVDSRRADDGDRVLRITAKQGASTGMCDIRYLVVNGKEAPYAADVPATLKLQVRGIDAADEVLFNGAPLGVIPAGTANEATAAFTVNPQHLRKFNRVLIRAAAQGAGRDSFSVGPVWLDYHSKKIHDLRYASFERHFIGGSNPRRSEKELYFCLP